MDEENATAKILKTLGQIIAIIMIVRYALIIINHYTGGTFIPTESVFATILNYIGVYAPMALMITVGLSAIWSKSFLIKLVFLIVCAAIIIFSFDFGIKGSIESFLHI